MIRKKIQEIVKNIEMFSMRRELGEYFFEFKKLRIKRDYQGDIYLISVGFWEHSSISINEKERAILKKSTNKRVEKKEKEIKIKEKKRYDEFFKKGTKLLNKINFN